MPIFTLWGAAPKLRRLRWLLALEREQAWLAYLLAGLLLPLGLLPRLPKQAVQPPSSGLEVLFAAGLLFVFLWVFAGPMVSFTQPLLRTLASGSSAVLWLFVGLLVLGWRSHAGARYLDCVRLTPPPDAREAC